MQRSCGKVERAGINEDLAASSCIDHRKLWESHVIADSEPDARKGRVKGVNSRSARKRLAFLRFTLPVSVVDAERFPK